MSVESNLVDACLRLLRAQFRKSSTEDLGKLLKLVSSGKVDLTSAETASLLAEYRQRTREEAA